MGVGGCGGTDVEASDAGNGDVTETFTVSSLLLELEELDSFDVVDIGSIGGTAGVTSGG